jgi:hypothetical protein
MVKCLVVMEDFGIAFSISCLIILILIVYVIMIARQNYNLKSENISLMMFYGSEIRLKPYTRLPQQLPFSDISDLVLIKWDKVDTEYKQKIRYELAYYSFRDGKWYLTGDEEEYLDVEKHTFTWCYIPSVLKRHNEQL